MKGYYDYRPLLKAGNSKSGKPHDRGTIVRLKIQNHILKKPRGCRWEATRRFQWHDFSVFFITADFSRLHFPLHFRPDRAPTPNVCYFVTDPIKKKSLCLMKTPTWWLFSSLISSSSIDTSFPCQLRVSSSHRFNFFLYGMLLILPRMCTVAIASRKWNGFIHYLQCTRSEGTI